MTLFFWLPLIIASGMVMPPPSRDLLDDKDGGR
jgi:hypothetical protein